MDRTIYTRMAEHEDRHWWFRARRNIVASLLRRITGDHPSCRIAEVGCGTGGNLAMLRQFGGVDGVECDDWARDVAGRKSGIVIMPGRLPDALPLEPSAYDVIALLDVLEHVEDDLGALCALGATLRRSGRLIATVPALPWLWSAHDERHHHYRRYTPGKLRATVEAAGFTVEACGYFNTLLFPVLFAVRLVKRLTGSSDADDALPPAPLNAVLGTIFGLERHLVGRVPLPIGASLFLIARPLEVTDPAAATVAPAGLAAATTR